MAPTMPRASWDFIGKLRCPLPPPDEQRAIADFLDRETAKIDTLVAKKRTLIERLKEKRTALIARTVTRGLPPDAARAAGLDPHPKLKPSGIDWLGDVPDHWTVTKSMADRVARALELQDGNHGELHTTARITYLMVFAPSGERHRRRQSRFRCVQVYRAPTC